MRTPAVIQAINSFLQCVVSFFPASFNTQQGEISHVRGKYPNVRVFHEDREDIPHGAEIWSPSKLTWTLSLPNCDGFIRESRKNRPGCNAGWRRNHFARFFFIQLWCSTTSSQLLYGHVGFFASISCVSDILTLLLHQLTLPFRHGRL
jgi:hypothetical protein